MHINKSQKYFFQSGEFSQLKQQIGPYESSPIDDCDFPLYHYKQ